MFTRTGSECVSTRRVCVREVIGQQQAAALRDNEPTTTDDDDGHRRRSCAFFACRPPLFTLPLPPAGRLASVRTASVTSPRGWGKRRRGRAQRHFPTPPPVFPVKFKIGGGRRPRRQRYWRPSVEGGDEESQGTNGRGDGGGGVVAGVVGERERDERGRRTGLARCDARAILFFIFTPFPARPSTAAGGHAASTVSTCYRIVMYVTLRECATWYYTRVHSPPPPEICCTAGARIDSRARGAFPPCACTWVIINRKTTMQYLFLNIKKNCPITLVLIFIMYVYNNFHNNTYS